MTEEELDRLLIYFEAVGMTVFWLTVMLYLSGFI